MLIPLHFTAIGTIIKLTLHQYLHFCWFLTLNGNLCVVHLPCVLNEIIEKLTRLDNTKVAKPVCLFTFLSLLLKRAQCPHLYRTSNWERGFMDLALCFCFFGKTSVGFSGGCDFLDCPLVGYFSSG